MIRENIRETVKTLYDQGKKKKEIARFLKMGVKTVRRIIKSECNTPKTRSDKILVDEDIIKKLYDTCDGYVQRIYEKLNEEMNIEIGYSTLTRLVREYITGKDDVRSKSFPDIPGEEMQHDTSDYYLKIGDKKIKVICSGIYFRYSKMRYIKFYPRFNRFRMQCFFHESLRHFGYTARICIIDNTNLAVLHGTGENAVFNPEMISFLREYGFTWKAHRIRLSNRKAGKERNFWTLETNFFPGRSFKSLDDLNKQAREWALEEQKLRALGDYVNSYLDFIRSKDCTIKPKPAFIRQLYGFSKKLTPRLFEKCIERALKYKLDTINSPDRVASILVNDDVDYSIEPTSSNNEYEKRPSCQKGKVSREEGLDKFQKIVEEGSDVTKRTE